MTNVVLFSVVITSASHILYFAMTIVIILRMMLTILATTLRIISTNLITILITATPSSQLKPTVLAGILV